MPAHPHLTGVRLKEAHDVLQGDTLADTAPAQHDDCFTTPHLEANVIEHSLLAKCLGDVNKLDVLHEASSLLLFSHDRSTSPSSRPAHWRGRTACAATDTELHRLMLVLPEKICCH